MQEIKEISILYTQSLWADCLNHPITFVSKMPFTHQCFIFDSHPAGLWPQLYQLLFTSDFLYFVYVYKFDIMLHKLT